VPATSLKVGPGGVQLDMLGLKVILLGGVEFATPDVPGRRVRRGHEFDLHPTPRREWLRWAPEIPP